MERSDNQTKRQTDKSIWKDLTIRQKDKQINLYGTIWQSEQKTNSQIYCHLENKGNERRTE